MKGRNLFSSLSMRHLAKNLYIRFGILLKNMAKNFQNRQNKKSHKDMSNKIQKWKEISREEASSKYGKKIERVNFKLPDGKVSFYI